jgi:hypothetical protein
LKEGEKHIAQVSQNRQFAILPPAGSHVGQLSGKTIASLAWRTPGDARRRVKANPRAAVARKST